MTSYVVKNDGDSAVGRTRIYHRSAGELLEPGWLASCGVGGLWNWGNRARRRLERLGLRACKRCFEPSGARKQS